MAGSITVTATDLGAAITKYQIAWTADASGNLNGNSFAIKRGHLISAKFVPGATAPTNNYTIKLNDPDGADLLAGAANANLSSSTASYLAPGLGGGATVAFVEGFSAVTPVLSVNVVASAQGTIVLYVGP